MRSNWKLEGAILVEEIKPHQIDVLGDALNPAELVEPEMAQLGEFLERWPNYRSLFQFELEFLKLGGALE